MAKAQEEIIIIEEQEAAGLDTSDSTGHKASLKDGLKRHKRKVFIALGLSLFILIITLLLLLLNRDEPQSIEDNFDKPLNFTPKKKYIEPSKLEKMIAKANLLYTQGQQSKALQLFEQIAQYSEGISQYNLGVAQLKQQQYEKAIISFKRAIGNGENLCASAINAAVSAYNLHDKERFNYYIDLARVYLPQENGTELYAYYYALINYYKQNYFEALSALNHPSSDYYPEVKKHLKSRIDALFSNYYDAINTLDSNYDDKDAFSMGLLYANVGDLTLAKKYLLDAIAMNPKPINEQLAMALIHIKSGQHAQAATLLKESTDMYKEEVYKPYPIEVHIRKSIYNPDMAQAHYRNTLLKRKDIFYQYIFYFAPFKIFDAKRTISYIRKGTANMFIDDIQSAKAYLQGSSTASSINYAIAQAISKSLQFKIRDANSELKALITLNPKHSILHYNLALTYAQMNDMPNAHKHFLRAYHLDAKNYLAGIFAIFTSQITGKQSAKMESILKENLALEDESEEFELYRTLLDISQNNFVSAIKWLNNSYKERPLYLYLSSYIASKLSKDALALTYAKKLSILQKNDLLPQIIYANLKYKDLTPKAYANAMLNHFKDFTFHYKDLYFGPFITRYLYSTIALFSGRIYALAKEVQQKYATTNENPIDIINLLALVSIYTQEYEKAYTLYNQLIDEYKLRTPMVLFLGGLASIGANHHANAIALFELSKLKNPNFLESRFALALLYLEAKNNHGASIQLQKIGDSGFVSDYFNFDIDSQALLFKKRKKSNIQKKETHASST